MENSKGIIPEPLNVRKRDDTLPKNNQNAGTTNKAEHKPPEKDPDPLKSPESSPSRDARRGCLPCYYIHERCSLRDTPSVPCTRCQQKSLECVMYPSPNGPRDPERGFTAPRSMESKTREESGVVRGPSVRPRGPRARSGEGGEEGG
ncbi:hypothetical protein HYALB_00002637 [Hymenoscyphus albidus]|uniref:Zn(2)-C6 fungal-type domain-containing protein n=1 Tax=Hymenoscyphus albidus TaxID=595503 RepID=A0A9N9LRA7_9HELO|nr:hypothetical protein HYALB_00002637 [Hymenoscyphus albidus]